MYDRGAVPHNLRANAPAGMGEPQTRRRVLRRRMSARSLKCEAYGVEVKMARMLSVQVTIKLLRIVLCGL